MKRKIIQFGDSLNDLFIFTPFQEEDDWGETVEPSLLALQFADGSYRQLGYDQSRKPQKVVTKRFSLYSKDLIKDFLRHTHNTACESEDGREYMTTFIDYMYRGLRGGVKKLYAIMEDGSIRYTYAEAISIPYQTTYTDPNKWLNVSVDFLLHDPYWYEVKDANTYLYQNIQMTQIIGPCFLLDDDQVKPTSLVSFDNDICLDSCGYNGVILKNESLTGYVGEKCFVENGCQLDPCSNTQYSSVSGDTFVQLCITGSAGADDVIISLNGAFLNPKITNTKNNDFISYQGTMSASHYINIDLGSSLTGDIEDYDIETNIPGFNLNNLNINDDVIWQLETGVNMLKVEGGLSNKSYFGVKYLNKYHN